MPLGLLVALLLGLAGACDLVAEPSAPAIAASPTVATPRQTPRLTLPVPTPEPSFLIYQVRPNDALASIAKRFRTTVDSIGYWNRARYASLDPDSSAYKPDSIQVGWLLRIHPGETTDGEDLAPTDEPSPSESPDASPSEPPADGGSTSPAA